MITMKRTPYGTLLTIVKYGDFQDRKDTEGTRKGRPKDTEGTRKGRNKELRKNNLKEEKEESLPPGEETDQDDDWFEQLEDESVTNND